MKTAIVVELDQEELAVRILEAQLGPRPSGCSASETLRATDDQMVKIVMKMAMAAMRYLEERINAQERVQ